jgi:hypothetical protein
VKSRSQLSTTDVLDEAQKLFGVSDRLDLLADQHPKASDAIFSIAHSVRDSAILLEGVVATKVSMPTNCSGGQCLASSA